MKGFEKVARIEELTKVPMITFKEANEIAELRQGLKVSDFFYWLRNVKQEFRCSPDCFYKLMGSDTKGFKSSARLQAAIEAGFVKSYSVRKYSMDIRYIELTRKGEQVMFKAE